MTSYTVPTQNNCPLHHWVFRYRRSVTERHSRLAVAACWAAAVLLSFTPLFGWNRQSAVSSAAHSPNSSSTSSSSSTVCRFTDVISMSYLVYFTFFLCNLLPLCTMALLYGLIFRNIRRSLREMPGRSGPPPSGPTAAESRSFLRKEGRLAASLSQVLGLFALCWLPLHLMNCVVMFGGPSPPAAAFHVGILLSHANSAANPVVYASRIPRIRKAYLKMWLQATGRPWLISHLPASHGSDNGTGSNSHEDKL